MAQKGWRRHRTLKFVVWQYGPTGTGQYSPRIRISSNVLLLDRKPSRIISANRSLSTLLFQIQELWSVKTRNHDLVFHLLWKWQWVLTLLALPHFHLGSNPTFQASEETMTCQTQQSYWKLCDSSNKKWFVIKSFQNIFYKLFNPPQKLNHINTDRE